ncbi:MAG: hypothetical protein PHD01_05720 [Geobacteraceae bacterium]|nr:hypothetical protein [Geobacteraceae bacterium]
MQHTIFVKPNYSLIMSRQLKHSWIIIVFYVLYFSWDRLTEANFLLGEKAGLVRPLLILLLWVYAFFTLPRIKHQIPDFNLLRKYLIVIGFLSICSALRSWYIGIPLGSILYSLIQTQGFCLLPFYFSHISRSNYLVQRMLWLFLISSCLLGLGIFFDAIYGFSNILVIPGLEEVTKVELSGLQRGNFLVGTNMAFISLSIGVISGYLLLTKIHARKQSIIIFLIFAVTVGMYLTFSRASSILGGALCLLVLYKIILVEKIRMNKINLLILLFLLISFTLPTISNVTPDSMLYKYSEIFDSSGVGNEGRIIGWTKGISLFNDFDAWLGYGLGTSNPRMNSLFGLRYMGHYESGIFLTFSEAGFFGLFVLILPFIIVVYNSLHKKNDSIFIYWALLLLTNLFISPSITGYRTPMIIYAFLGLSLIFSTRRRKLRIQS